MTQWEYKTSPTVGTNLVALGMDGWELVCVDGASMHFKRPMAPAMAEEPAQEPVAAAEPEPEPEPVAAAAEPDTVSA